MGDAVKKSRIVSDASADENLEESLMEEFNLRLKSCMSQDDLHLYENGSSKTQDFLDNERRVVVVEENHYDVPKPIIIKTDDADQQQETNNIPDVTFQMMPPEIEQLDDDLENKQQTTKSIKDRMLLSTDDTSCLLFTQTITSPMLTPSEENIDFLKAFQKDIPPTTETNNDDTVDNVEIEFAKTFTEPIYENLDSLSSNKNRDDEHIYENIEEVKTEEEKIEATTTTAAEFVTKQIISKFEENTNVATTNNSVSSESYQTSTYVETTMIQDSMGGEEKIAVKKKKTKKSRKSDEKENISVCDTNYEQSFYNVNVKSLCRSFSDLTRIGEDSKLNDANKTHSKSMTEVNLNVFGAVSVQTLKSSFSKFDAMQKKNLLHVRSSDSSKAQEKFSGLQVEEANCKSCGKQVFQMEQIKAEKAIYHKNCFRCRECNKQLNVDTYQSHEGAVYCKPHFKALFAPKVVEDDKPQPRQNRHKLIICENEPVELPADVVRASDKPDLGLEELQQLNVKERFQVFEHHEDETHTKEMLGTVSVKRSPSILSKLARFQAKGMDVGVSDETLNGVPIEESSSEEEQEEVDDGIEGEDADLIRAKRVQKEKPFHFTGMSDVKNRWEQGVEQGKDERREERKQEIQTIRSRLFMGKQGKMKEAYQQAVLEAESVRKSAPSTPIEVLDTKSLKERFERGEVTSVDESREKEQEDMSVFESGIGKKSRSIFMELDANASKAPQLTPVSPSKSSSDVIKKTREVLLARQAADDIVKGSEQVDDVVTVRTADIQQRFKFFEAYKEPEQKKKEFRITPPREGQVKLPTPEREVDVVRAEEVVEDSVVAKQQHTATKMLSKFRQMEEELQKGEQLPQGPKPLKRFTPPPEPPRPETSSEEEEEEEEEEEIVEETKAQDVDLIEAQKAARAKQLRAKFEKWEANEIKKEQANGVVNIAEEFTDEQSQVESARSLRARFESMRETSTTGQVRRTTVKVNRFVEINNGGNATPATLCQSCGDRVYPLEKISVHGQIYHKNCFKCMECSTILRMDSYSYNQGLLYCLPHFKRLFIAKGNYDTAFGFGQHKEKWNNPTMA